MVAQIKYPEPLVFGLDIGTRSIVGTVGYREGNQFNIVAQCVKLHDSRVMLDGQIHDINKVGEEIIYVKENLEKQLGGRKLKEVCIAAAGRVLRTAVGNGFYEFSDNTVVNQEYIHSLELIGVEKAHELMVKENDTDVKFFCVGYTVVKYYLNGYEISNLEGHKAHNISADVLATFLPEEVVDGLYSAVALAGLDISNITLEPIAAIQVAIPENYRLLNIALIDVGAGTSDISITKDGSIVGYGMLPKAGDEITEGLIKEYLVDFNTAEKMKTINSKRKSLTYKDIMGISHRITPQEIYDQIDCIVDDIAKKIADKVIELNGNRSVSAAFVVGGGGKVPGFTDKLAEHLGIPSERVALRGQEVLGFVNILVDGVKKDPMLVTPIGICLNFYEQKNRFIFVHVNEERVTLYDNDKLTVFDAALSYGLTNESIFPKRGEDLNYMLNGKKKFIRGDAGEAACIYLNEKEVGLNHEVRAGDEIKIIESTKGEEAKAKLGEVVDLTEVIEFIVNDVKISCPKYACVNNNLVSEFYDIKEGDNVEILNYYTLGQLMKFMDIEKPHEIFVNGARADADTKIYENFNVAWISKEEIYKTEPFVSVNITENEEKNVEKIEEKSLLDFKKNKQAKTEGSEVQQKFNKLNVTVNGEKIVLTGKENYVFVDIFDKYQFDLKNVRGTELVQRVDGKRAEHFSALQEGSVVEIFWKDE